MDFKYEIMLYILFSIAIAAAFLFIVHSTEESFNTDYKFYNSTCPLLGAKVVEPKPGYVWTRLCFIEENNIASLYQIGKINNDYKLIRYNPQN